LKGNTALHLAAERGFLKIVEAISTSPSVELNIQNNEGLTPLHVAIEGGFLLVVQVKLF
jgi:ankyrin repeat protein